LWDDSAADERLTEFQPALAGDPALLEILRCRAPDQSLNKPRILATQGVSRTFKIVIGVG